MAPAPASKPLTNAEEANAPTPTNAPASTPKDTDIAMSDAPRAPRAPSPPPPSPPKKRKRKDNASEKQPHILYQSTFRKPTWSYFHLILVTPGTASLPPSTSTSTSTTTSTTTSTPNTPSLSPLLTSTLLSSPLRSYLGTTGTAIPMDILSIRGRDIWLRIPRRDARAFRASLAGWVGSCEGDDIPGLQQQEGAGGGGGGGGRVGVAWRVVREGGVLGGLTAQGDGNGKELFG